MNRKIYNILICFVSLAYLVYFPSTVRAGRSIVQIDTNHGEITLELYADLAPVTVNNFLGYVESDFYEGLIFHRVIEDFMIQAGVYDPNLYLADFGDVNFDLNDPAYYHSGNDPINLEVGADLDNLRGTVSMARTSDPDSATSQFFINVVDNDSLNPSDDSDGYAVFGVVADGMDVVDDIKVVDIFTANDDPDIAAQFEALPQVPVIINQATVVRQFDTGSDDFSDVPFIKATDGTTRTFAGLGTHAGQSYTHEFQEIEHLGVDCMEWKQNAQLADIDSFTIVLAKDTTDAMWVFQYIVNEGEDDEKIIIDPNFISDAVSFGDFAEENIHFRLATGSHNPNDPNDPVNTSTTGSGDDLITEQIVGFDVNLDHLPPFSEELILVKRLKGQQTEVFDWRYYHGDTGLILDMEDRQLEPNDTDIYGDGWFLEEPNSVMADSSITLKADKSRQNPWDSFNLTGTFDASQGDFIDSIILIQVGPWQCSIDTNDPAFKQSGSRAVYSYRGKPTGQEKVNVKINLDKGTFRINARKINLSRLEDPIKVTIAVGDYHGVGVAQAKGPRGVPMAYLLGYRDDMRFDNYIYVSDNLRHNDWVVVDGSFSTDEGPIDLTEMEMNLSWGTSNFTIKPEGFRQIGRSPRYVYHMPGGILRSVVFDFQKCTYKVLIKQRFISGPPRDFSVQIEDQNQVVLFDQEVSVH